MFERIPKWAYQELTSRLNRAFADYASLPEDAQALISRDDYANRRLEQMEPITWTTWY